MMEVEGDEQETGDKASLASALLRWAPPGPADGRVTWSRTEGHAAWVPGSVCRIRRQWAQLHQPGLLAGKRGQNGPVNPMR